MKRILVEEHTETVVVVVVENEDKIVVVIVERIVGVVVVVDLEGIVEKTEQVYNQLDLEIAADLVAACKAAVNRFVVFGSRTDPFAMSTVCLKKAKQNFFSKFKPENDLLG